MDAVMPTDVVLLEPERERLVNALQKACEKLKASQGELVLDFASVHRLDPGTLRAMESVADAGDGTGTKVTLRGVNVDVYKVLKLTKLAPRFTFQT
jgi:anti-anti-sigma regulatory factor